MEPIMLCALAVAVYGGIATLRDLARDLAREGVSPRRSLGGYWIRLNRYLLRVWDETRGWLAPPRQTVSLLYVRSSRPFSFNGAVQHAAQQTLRGPR